MNSQKLLIVSVLAALLIIGGAVAFVKFRSGDTSGTSKAGHVVVDEIMASCKPNDQCIVVDTTCSFCGNFVAINAKSEILFDQMLNETCKDYRGSYCDNHDLSSYPTCVNGKCEMVKWSENKQPARAPAARPAPAATPAPPVATPAPTPVPTTPAPVPSTAPVPAPAVQPTTPVQQQAPAQPATGAFGEEETPAPATAEPPPADDLYAPLPETFPSQQAPQDNGVQVIQP